MHVNCSADISDMFDRRDTSCSLNDGFHSFLQCLQALFISSYIPVPVVSISLCTKDVELFKESFEILVGRKALREKFCISAVVE
jgi:hypothetical protein